jgi:hypothetical protein
MRPLERNASYGTECAVDEDREWGRYNPRFFGEQNGEQNAAQNNQSACCSGARCDALDFFPGCIGCLFVGFVRSTGASRCSGKPGGLPRLHWGGPGTPYSTGPLPEISPPTGRILEGPNNTTVTVKAVPCTRAARSTDGTTTCIGLPDRPLKTRY